MINIGIIGYGYWGPNVVRNFVNNEGTRVKIICDNNQNSLNRAAKAYPGIDLTNDSRDVVESQDIDAVAVITPVSTHYISDRKNLKIMVDHTFLFTGAVRKIKQLIDEDILGNIYYYDSTRVNLGLFQHDINVVWDLAPHDFSVMDYIINENPSAVTAAGKSHINGFEDIAYITVHFTNNMIAHFNVNWLSPVKVRSTLIGGEKKMLVWNDIDADEKIKVYDKGIEIKNREGIYNLLVSYRSGDMWAPKVEQTEALGLETEYFVHCIVHDKTPMNDGHAGLRVVKVLEACNQSLKQDGKMVNI
jgi:predicted dehydrogenase